MPRAKLSRRALRWALEALVVAHLTVARVAEDAVDVAAHRVRDNISQRRLAEAGRTIEEHVVEGLKMGANDYLVKPLDAAITLARVETIEYRIEKVLVVDDRFRLRGLVTVKDIQKASENPNACKDDQGSLRAGAAVGVGAGTDERVAALVEAGVDVVVVDTAHGHSEGVLNRVRWVKQHYPDLQVIGCG